MIQRRDARGLDVNLTTVAISFFARMMTPLMGWMTVGTMRKCFENDLADIKAVAEQVSSPAL